MSSSSLPKPPQNDPYATLNTPFGATSAEISKAYKKLALQYHPDKADPNLSLSQKKRLETKFHDIQEARDFLLHDEARRKYDDAEKGKRMRQKEEEKRDKSMDERRKKLREELKEKERRERRRREGNKREREEDFIDTLRKEGKKMKEEYEKKVAEEAESKETRDNVKERQVRLKWSRSRVKVSHSEHSIADLLSRFGVVQSVELIGSKGNAALVTFRDATSCEPCVEFYSESDEMRAHFVGKRKRETDGGTFEARHDPSWSLRNERDFEDLEERKLRQAAERDELLRRMKAEEGEGIVDSDKAKFKTDHHRSSTTWDDIMYPPELPLEDDDLGLTPLQILEKFEKIVLPMCTSYQQSAQT